MGRSVYESGSLEPLETEGNEEMVQTSDHRVAFCKVEILRKKPSDGNPTPTTTKTRVKLLRIGL